MNPIRWLKSLRFRLFYAWLTKPGGRLVTLGSGCPWTFCDAYLQADSNVLCAGVGNDISFEKEMISKYGTQLVLLDPSPTGMATIAREIIPETQVRFLPLALAGQDGVLDFQTPRNPNEGSFRMAIGPSQEGVHFASKSLSTLMSELHWRRIDFLKMDIEGAEYGVIDELTRKSLDVRQICVEFHYGSEFGRTRWDMIKRILALHRKGFGLVHHVHQDHTFLRRSGSEKQSSDHEE